MLLNKLFILSYFLFLFSIHPVWGQQEEENQEFVIEFNPVPGEELVDFGMIWPTNQEQRVITVNCTPDCKGIQEQLLEISPPYSALFMHSDRYGTDGYIVITYSPKSPGYDVDTLKFDYTASDGINEVTGSVQWDVVGKAMSRDRPQ